jgi:hypothetical protein
VRAALKNRERFLALVVGGGGGGGGGVGVGGGGGVGGGVVVAAAAAAVVVNRVCARDFFVLFSGCTPLHCSADNGHIGVCRLLLQSNADVQARDDR